MSGSARLTCRADGSWDSEPPTCEAVDCGALDTPFASGTVIVAATTFGAAATYACEDGYELVGDVSRTCQADGVWSGSHPTCDIVDCGKLNDTPSDGSLDVTVTTFGATVTYTCDTGYSLVGDSSRTCQADGSWSNATPACQPSSCDTLDPFTHGSINTNGATFGSTATYTCDPGYGLSGEALRSCQADGSWSGVAPTCAIVDCGNLDDAPDRGTLHIADTTFGAAATYACNPGYNLNGDSSRTCQADGSWSGVAPTCAIVDCSGPGAAPTNGAINVTDTTFGAEATYTCDPGYGLSGEALRSCQADGSWSGAAPTCTVVDCGSPARAPTNGTLQVMDTTYGASATYACDAGYILDGTATRTCRANGSWSGFRPSCDANACVPNPCQNGGRCRNSGSSYSCSCNSPWTGQNCANCGTLCSSRTGYYRRRFLTCLGRNTQQYCLAWVGCRGDLYIDATYGTLTFPKPSQCP